MNPFDFSEHMCLKSRGKYGSTLPEEYRK